MPHLRLLLLALVMAFLGAPVAANDKCKYAACYETTKKQLLEHLKAKAYRHGNTGHVGFKVEFRPNPQTIDGQGYSGYIAIQAEDNEGRFCHWFVVIKPRSFTKIDKNRSDSDPANQYLDWFKPHIYNRDKGCSNVELNADGSILKGIESWRSVILGGLQSQFNNLPFASEHPMGEPASSLLGTVEYETDRITLRIEQLMIKQLQQMPLNKFLPIPMKKN